MKKIVSLMILAVIAGCSTEESVVEDFNIRCPIHIGDFTFVTIDPEINGLYIKNQVKLLNENKRQYSSNIKWEATNGKTYNEIEPLIEFSQNEYNKIVRFYYNGNMCGPEVNLGHYKPQNTEPTGLCDSKLFHDHIEFRSIDEYKGLLSNYWGFRIYNEGIELPNKIKWKIGDEIIETDSNFPLQFHFKFKRKENTHSLLYEIISYDDVVCNNFSYHTRGKDFYKDNSKAEIINKKFSLKLNNIGDYAFPVTLNITFKDTNKTIKVENHTKQMYEVDNFQITEYCGSDQLQCSINVKIQNTEVNYLVDKDFNVLIN